ncbi:MAG: FtsX-like permease family protein, partial [Mollicutes bacterium]|nr:FtsX-like permease family protein [Mollicutes bacterium]
MQIYRSLYDIPIMVFVFDYSNVLLYSSIMIILILLCIMLVAFSALKEHVSTLFSGKAPTAGKKILIERITFLWKHLSFKQKSMLRNVFRFKKNLIMMLIGIGGCTGILLTSFGLKDSLSVIQTTQYNEIIKYDLIVSVNDINDNPINESSESEPIYYLTGEVLSQNENIDVSILSSNNLTNYVNLFDNDFNENSIIVTNQIADQLNLKVGENIVVDCPSQNIFVQLRVSGITTNYINNYIYLGEKAFKNYFGDLTKNAFLVKNDMTSDELTSYTRELLLNNNVTSVSSTSDIAYTYENILNNLNSIVAILVLLSGALIAVVIYNLTDIIITERIKEIATLRVTGYTRRESLLYIFREIIFMTILGICLGLVIGVFLHRYVMINITSIGLCFGESIAPLSYLYTIILALGFMIITTTCFYPKIKKIQMAEALKSVE